MSLAVYTAQISTRDPDRFDVTRKSGGPVGVIFAPSWAILRPALDARKEAARLLDRAKAEPEHRVFYEGRAAGTEYTAWVLYMPAYRLEMLASHRANRAAWDALLARPRVALACYCTDPERCHRRLLAGFLAKLGADDRGEL